MSEAKARHFEWHTIPKEKVTDLISRRLITGDQTMLAHVYLDKGSIMPKHSHINEQFTYVLEGALLFYLGENGEEQVTVRTGEVLHIPSNLPHEAHALEDTLDLDIFTPIRQDWLDGTDSYFHEG